MSNRKYPFKYSGVFWNLALPLTLFVSAFVCCGFIVVDKILSNCSRELSLMGWINCFGAVIFCMAFMGIRNLIEKADDEYNELHPDDTWTFGKGW